MRRGECSKLAAARAALKILVRVGVADSLDGAGNPHLPFHAVPPEGERSPWVPRELPPLAAGLMSKEYEAARVESFEKHDPGVWTTVLGDRAQGHSVRRVDPGGLGVGEPAAELLHGVGVRVCFRKTPA